MRLRVLDRYTTASVLKIGLVTSLLASLMLMGVDLFTNLDKYMSYNVSFLKALSITLYYFPEAFLLAVGPAFLFAVTYHLSMLSANNEVMAVLNAGVSFQRILRPVIISAILLSGAYFAFNELVAIPSTNTKELQMELITESSGSENNHNIALSDMQNGYMVFAGMYSEAEQTLYVGDSEVDLQTAANSGLACISVDWGFRERAFLEGCHAPCTVSCPQEIGSLLLGNRKS